MTQTSSFGWEDGITLPARTLRSLDRTDTMSPELRACVHEFGGEIVNSLLTVGVEDPGQIRAVVHSIWMGARQPAQRNQLGRSRSPVLDNLDWLMLQAGAGITAATLLRVLWQHSMVIVPRDPSTIMVGASVDAVKHMGTVSKAQKHHGRLKAAILASTKRLWPHLLADSPPSRLASRPPTPTPQNHGGNDGA